MISRLARWWLMFQWRRTLTFGERVRLDHWGATGNPKHHPFSWVGLDDK